MKPNIIYKTDPSYIHIFSLKTDVVKLTNASFLPVTAALPHGCILTSDIISLVRNKITQYPLNVPETYTGYQRIANSILNTCWDKSLTYYNGEHLLITFNRLLSCLAQVQKMEELNSKALAEAGLNYYLEKPFIKNFNYWKERLTLSDGNREHELFCNMIHLYLKS